MKTPRVKSTTAVTTLGPYRLAPGPMLPPVDDPRWKRRKRRLLRGGLALAALALVAMFHTSLLETFAGFFRVDDPAASDAIVVLIGGPDHRPARAAELYKAGIAPVVLVGTSTSDQAAVYNETEIAIGEMLRLGVPRRAILVLPGQVTSTRHEAQRVSEYARAHPMKRITVVTTAFHTARARWIFRKAMRGQGIDIRMAAAPHPAFDERDWFRSDEGLVTYFSEVLKILYYRIRY